MSTEHPITPPPELVHKWCDEDGSEIKTSPRWYRIVATQAARWGADAELEACCDWLYNTCCDNWDETQIAAELRAARRPQPPSLAEEAQRILVENGRTFGGRVEFDLEDVVTIRAALERLQQLEQENNG